jgi:hypothetical protein
MSQFFITGLPRSRTKWFAEYFDQLPGVTCYHELQNQCPSRDEFYEKMEADGYIGDSDSGLFLTDFQRRWPNAPVVIIERDIGRVRDSLARVGIMGVDILLERAQERLDKMRGFRVPFGEVDLRLRDIHDWLGIDWEKGHARRMIKRNIQLDKIVGSVEAYRAWEDG